MNFSKLNINDLLQDFEENGQDIKLNQYEYIENFAYVRLNFDGTILFRLETSSDGDIIRIISFYPQKKTEDIIRKLNMPDSFKRYLKENKITYPNLINELLKAEGLPKNKISLYNNKLDTIVEKFKDYMKNNSDIDIMSSININQMGNNFYTSLSEKEQEKFKIAIHLNNFLHLRSKVYEKGKYKLSEIIDTIKNSNYNPIGNCTGLTYLYIAILSRLDISAKIVSFAGHVLSLVGNHLFVENTLGDIVLLNDSNELLKSKQYRKFMTDPKIESPLCAISILNTTIANQAHKLDNIEEALFRNKYSLEYNPTYILGLYYKARILFKIGKSENPIKEPKDIYTDALLCLNEALELFPRHANSFILKGKILEALNKTSEAIEVYKHALDQNIKRDTTLNKLGKIFLRLERYESAIECFEKALEIDPDQVGFLIQKGKALIGLEKYSKALVCCEKALKISPINNDLSNFINEILEKANIILEINSDRIDLYHIKGQLLVKIGDDKTAIETYKLALSQNPDDNTALKRIGVALFELKQYDSALECFEKVNLDYSQDYLEAIKLIIKGAKLIQSCDYSGAIKLYEKAADIQPRDEYLLKELAASLDKLGQYDLALECCESLLNIDPDNCWALNFKKNSSEPHEDIFPEDCICEYEF